MENPASDSVFMKIINREIPADIVYEDDDTIAFLDIHPNNPGHTLVVPKRYSRNLLDMEEADAARLFIVVHKVAKAIKAAVNAEGINLGMNNEPAAGQIIFHAHVHVIPRYEGDGFHTFPPGPPYPDGEAEQIAEKIRAQLFARAV